MGYCHSRVEFWDGSVLPKAPQLNFIPWIRLLEFFPSALCISFRATLYIWIYEVSWNRFVLPFISLEFYASNLQSFSFFGSYIWYQFASAKYKSHHLSCKTVKSRKRWISVNPQPISCEWPKRALKSRTLLSFKTFVTFVNTVLETPRFHAFKKYIVLSLKGSD